MRNLAQPLNEGIEQLGLKINAQQQEQLLNYLALLAKWNKAYNLTAITQPKEMLIKHLLDSLAVVPFIEADELLDVGSGAGIPSIPLAIVLPDLRVNSLDSNGKKTRFQFQAKVELGLANFNVQQARVENAQLEQPSSQIISRAFASLNDFVSLTASLAASQAKWLAMKGLYPQEELADLPQGFRCLASHLLDVPFLNEQRHLLVLSREE